MKLSQFKFKLPEELVALEPTFHRDECRLMVLHRKSGKIEMTKQDEDGNDLKDEEGNPVYLDFRTTRRCSLPVCMVRRRRPMPR